jgi:hypothetical protein
LSSRASARDVGFQQHKKKDFSLRLETTFSKQQSCLFLSLRPGVAVKEGLQELEKF